jgi:hypothetical protein
MTIDLLVLNLNERKRIEMIDNHSSNRLFFSFVLAHYPSIVVRYFWMNQLLLVVGEFE